MGVAAAGNRMARASWVEVELEAIGHNYQAIAAHTQVPLMPVVKANAYGHGLVAVATYLQRLGAPQLAVALVEEGIALRQAGIGCPILVLGGIHPPQLPLYLAHGLEITVSSLENLRQVEAAAQAAGRQAVVHLKLDTGMGRIGVASEDARPLIEAALASPQVALKGIYSHLACADDPAADMTRWQLQRFQSACTYFDRIGAPMPLRHLANSGGILHHSETWLDMVRPGILLYGVLPDPAARRTVAVRPALSLKSRTVYAKVVEPGTCISYGATWRAEQTSGIVTVPLGYGDGWPRALSSRGEVLVAGKRCRIAGRVCMDQFMVDVGDAPAASGEAVTLIGRQGEAVITVEEVAAWCQTIPYEILVQLNTRLPRHYV